MTGYSEGQGLKTSGLMFFVLTCQKPWNDRGKRSHAIFRTLSTHSFRKTMGVKIVSPLQMEVFLVTCTSVSHVGVGKSLPLRHEEGTDVRKGFSEIFWDMSKK